jgi:hypothetical protein
LTRLCLLAPSRRKFVHLLVVIGPTDVTCSHGIFNGGTQPLQNGVNFKLNFSNLP